MLTANKLILHNFKRFKHLELDLNPKINILIGDNESGKSTILQALSIISSGSRNKMENMGFNNLFNVEAIDNFLSGDKNLSQIPQMYIELYFSGSDEDLEGKNNSKKINSCGIRMKYFLDNDNSKSVKDILHQENPSFPFEFFKVEFSTFAGIIFNGYNRKWKTISIDNSYISPVTETKFFAKSLFTSIVEENLRNELRNEYSKIKSNFTSKSFSDLNEKIKPYSFALINDLGDDLDSALTLKESSIRVDNAGMGKQCFIKTKLALSKAAEDIDTVLIEEPENHLSFVNMLKLIKVIGDNKSRQLFISTHSDLITTRLGLRNCILLSPNSMKGTSLSFLSLDTADFFMKAPDSNMLKFVLSSKVVLVEGDAEYILMESFCRNIHNKSLEDLGIVCISVDGKCFKRYLEIAIRLKNKVAVITDNDKDYKRNIEDSYMDYVGYPNIKIFSDHNEEFRYTFEACLYQDNKELCDKLFNSGGREKDVLSHMISNKADVAFRLSLQEGKSLFIPDYIKKALTWIKE